MDATPTPTSTSSLLPLIISRLMDLTSESDPPSTLEEALVLAQGVPLVAFTDILLEANINILSVTPPPSPNTSTIWTYLVEYKAVIPYTPPTSPNPKKTSRWQKVPIFVDSQSLATPPNSFLVVRDIVSSVETARRNLYASSIHVSHPEIPPYILGDD